MSEDMAVHKLGLFEMEEMTGALDANGTDAS
jgi:hypothetical protein